MDQTTILGLAILLISSTCMTRAVEILVHPESRLITTDTHEVYFYCKFAHGSESYWVVNRQPSVYPDQIARLNAQGYFFTKEINQSITTLTLQVDVTLDKNGTEVYCSYPFSTISNKALLLIISEPPFSPNLLVENQNSSSVTLKWSPLYLWQGKLIDYYIVSVINTSGISVRHRVNTTFSDVTVSFTSFSESVDIRTCEELIFTIEAVGKPLLETNRHDNLTSYTLVGGYLPTTLTLVLSPILVNTSVLFEADGDPLLFMDIKLPASICTYQDFYYTILLTANDHEANDTQLGPYYHRGSPGTLSRNISKPHLVRGKEYYLEVFLVTVNGNASSQEYSFDTRQTFSLHKCNINVDTDDSDKHVSATIILYKLATGIFAGVVLCLILANSCAIITICIIHKKEVLHESKSEGGFRRHIGNNLVHNPIYDGLQYESIQPKFETLKIAQIPSTTPESADNGEYHHYN